MDRPQSDLDDIWQDEPQKARPPLARTQPPRLPARRRQPERPGRRWLSVLGYAVLAIACLGVGTVAFLLIAAPVELIRDRVVEQVKGRTGQTLTVAGPISLQFFPRPAVSLGEVSLAASDGEQTFTVLAAPRVDAELSLWSILTPHAAVERVVLHKPTIELGFDAQGRPLWNAPAPPGRRAHAVEAPGKDTATAAPSQPKPEPRAERQLSRFGLSNVRIVDGTVRYRGRDGEITEASSVQAVASSWGAADALKFDGTMTIHEAPIAFSATVASPAALMARQASQLSVKASGPPFEASYEGMVSLGDGLALEGAIRVEAASLEALARWTGKPVSGAIGSGRLGLAAKVAASRARITVSELRASVGERSVAGTLAVETGGERRRVTGSLDVSDLDFASLLVKPHRAEGRQRTHHKAAPEPPSATPRAGLPPGAQPTAQAERHRGWSDEPYNVALLRALDADLTVTARRILYRELKTGPGELHLALDGGSAKVTVEHVELYGGRARGTLTLDGSADVLVTGSSLLLEGVALHPLLSDAIDFQWLEGKGRVSLAVAGQGLSERQIVAGLNGRVEIASEHGAIVGFDVGEVVRSLQSARFPSLRHSPDQKTHFKELAGTFTITNGVARNDDLRLVGPHLQLNGEGSVDLGQRLVDYTVRTKVGGAPEADATIKVGTIEVPVSISGPWDKPSIGIKGQEHLTGALKQIRKNLRSQDVRDAIRGLLEGDKSVKPRDLIDKFLKKE